MTSTKIYARQGAFVIVMLLSLFLSFQAIAKTKEKAQVKFSETTFDFGYIKENGGPVSHEFTFTNEGPGNLVILDAKAECGCTTPEFPDAPVAEGKKGKIKVTYNPLGRPGGFTKVVTVKTNGSPSKISLKIRGTVVPKNN